MNCLFCQIAAGKIPAKLIYEDEYVVAFNDINPQAPQHKIIIPREHIATLNDLEPKHAALVGHLMLTGARIAKDLNISEDGYRLLMNCNGHGGQTVFHIHAHLVGGRQMGWPPG